MTEDISRLPVWARNRIQKLESDVQYLEQQLAQVEGTEATNVYLIRGMQQAPLPMHSGVRFKIGDGEGVDCYIDREYGRVRIGGHNRITVHPAAANVVYVDVERLAK